MASISAVLIVYNEEQRIEAALKSLCWCDEIIVADRNSSDRTVEIARKYTDKVHLLPSTEFSPQDIEFCLSKVGTDWMLLATASDLIHPSCASQVRELISRAEFPYDIIAIPFRRYVLGLESKRSPWYSKLNSGILFRKKIARVNLNSVHGALTLDSARKYEMPDSAEACMYHLTHSTMDIMMDRHLIYFRAEARVFPAGASLWQAVVDIFRAAYVLVFKRKTILLGWDGVALGMAYLSYWLLRFVYIWERRCSKAPAAYDKIRQDIERAWEAAEADGK